MADVIQEPPTPAETADAEASEAQIAVHWREEEYYPPPATFKEQANANDEAILEQFKEERFPDSFAEYDPLREPAMRPSLFQAYVRIMMGCDKFCTYCIVPAVRGPEQSRPPGVILEGRDKRPVACYSVGGDSLSDLSTGQWALVEGIRSHDGDLTVGIRVARTCDAGAAGQTGRSREEKP